MDGVNQRIDVFWWRELRNAVAQIKHVAGVGGAKTIEHLTGFVGDRFGRCKQHIRVEIALKGNLVSNAAAGIANVDAPIQTHRIATDSGDFL